jgi:hypothetical protein
MGGTRGSYWPAHVEDLLIVVSRDPNHAYYMF